MELQSVEEREKNGLCYLPEIVVEGLLIMLDEECLQFQSGHRANILNGFDSILK